MFDPVPWFVGGGAEHSNNVARNLAFGAFNSQEGIVTPTALEVRALAVPGSAVRVLPGTCAIQVRAAGITDEMYVGRNPSEDTVSLVATTSSGARSDLIVARVENPYLDGEPFQVPANAKTGPYIYTRVIQNVPAGTTSVVGLNLGYSAIPLARIDIPASTGTITQAMITDLRFMTNERTQRRLLTYDPAAATATAGTSQTAFATLGDPFATQTVPTWATHVRFMVHMVGLIYGGTGNNGGAGWNVRYYMRARINWADGSFGYTPLGFLDASVTTGIDRTFLAVGHVGLYVPSTSRGKPISMRLETQQVSGGSGALQINGNTHIFADVEYYAAPISTTAA